VDNLILLISCFVLGILLRRAGRMPENTPAVLNSFVINVSLPALTLLTLHQLHPQAALLYAALMAWLLFGLGAAFFYVMGKRLGLPGKTVGALMLTGGLGNTSFVGLPMIEAYYGHQALGIGIIADQLGSFLVLATLGLLVAGYYTAERPSIGAIAKKILLFPPFMALLAAVALMPVAFPPWLESVLHRLGGTLAPLALLSVGYQLRLGHLAGNSRNLALGLVFKLVIGPALLLLLFAGVLGARGEVLRVTLFEAAMAPMITGAIVALEHDLDPPLVGLMLGVGIPLSFLTLPVWWYLLRGF